MYKLLCVLLTIALCATAAFGQATDGNIVGTIVDASDAVIPAAQVIVKNVATGVARTVQSDASGVYRVNNLLVGTYSITVQAPGFETTALENVDVALNRTTTANVTLQVGTVETQINVIEAATLIDTTTATVGSSFESREAIYNPVSSLPLGVYCLALMSAGVASSGGVGLGEGPSVGGQRPRQNNFMVEGVDNNRKEVTGSNIRVPSEAVAEFTALQNQFTSEFGHSNGGQFNIALRSGGNDIHGSLYLTNENRNYNAMDQADKRQGLESLPRYDNNIFGGSVGGPIIRNKLFYYGLFEYNPLGQAPSPSAAVYAPTAQGYSILDSMQGLSATNYNILKTYADPAPTASTTTTVLGQEIPIGVLPIQFPAYSNEYKWLANIDYNLSVSDQIRGRYIQSDYSGIDIDTSPALPAFANNRKLGSALFTTSWLHTFTPTLFNEMRLGYGRFRDDIPAGSYDFPGLDVFPNILIEQDLNLQLGPLPEAPQGGVENHYQLVNNTTWVKGNHEFKFGIDARRYINWSIFIQRSRGDYTYSTMERYLLDIQPEFAERNVGSATHWANQWNFYWYAQDEWRMKRNITLNIGLRHEYRGIPAADKLQALNSVSSVPGLLEFREPKAQKANFAPRIGITWSPGTAGTTVVRAGFGMAYDNYFDNLGVLSKPPQLESTTYLEGSDEQGFLAGGGIPPNMPGEDLTPEEWRALTGTYIFDQQLPYSISWNLGIERVIANDYTFNIRYLGTRGVRLFTQSMMNLRPLVSADHNLPTYLQAPSQSELDALTLTLDDLLDQYYNDESLLPAYHEAGFTNAVFGFPNRGNSIYHGLAIELERRFSNGLLFNLAYTWSKSIDDSTADLFSTVLSPRRPQDFQDMRAERSKSFLDRTHRFTYTWVYEVPWMKNQAQWYMRNLVGNWTFSGTYVYESPQYATVQSQRDANLNWDSWTDRAIVNPNGREGTGSDVSELLNSDGLVVGYLADDPSAQYIRLGYGAWATAGRQTLPQGNINNFDLGLSKRFAITESKAFEIRGSFFNAFNHPQYTPGAVSDVRSTSTNTVTRNHLLPGHELFGDYTQVFPSHSRSIVLDARFTF